MAYATHPRDMAKVSEFMAVDAKAPKVENFQFKTNLIDISRGTGFISISMTLSDNLSGVKSVAIWVTSPAGKNAVGANIWDFTGSIKNPTYEQTFSVNQYLDPGKYTVRVSLTDYAGNSSYYYLPDTIRVTNGASGFADGKAYYAGTSKTLSVKYDNLYLAGESNLTGKGHAGNNIVSGNDGHNKLFGLDGDDRLFGGAGNDTLDGGTGADYLSGGSGNDAASYMNSKAGLTVSLSQPTINSGEARGDTFYSVENLIGSSFNDKLHGNEKANILNGGSGNDYLFGYDGKDSLLGGEGNDVLNGGLHNDVLTGGGGKDTFVFSTALGSNNIDSIADFNVNDDAIHLEHDIFTRLTQAGASIGFGTGAVIGNGGSTGAAVGSLGSNSWGGVVSSANSAGILVSREFVANDTGMAADKYDRIIYEIDTGKLFYDADGSGKGLAVHFATLEAGLALAADDFFVI